MRYNPTFLQRNLPEIARYPRRFTGSLPARYALLAWPLEEAQVESLSNRLRAPNEARELALTVARCRQRVHATTPEGLLELLKAADALRRPQRFAELLDAAQAADARIDRARIERALAAASAVDAGSIARSAPASDIARRIDEARLQAIRSLG